MIAHSVFIGLLLASDPLQDPQTAPIVSGVTSLAVEDEADDDTPPTDWEPAPLRLELHEAIAAAMSNNATVQGALLDAEAAWAGHGAAWGAFDTTFFTTLTRSENVQAPTPANFVGGINVGGSPATQVDVFTWRTGLRGQFETGTTWEVGIGPTWVRTNAGFGSIQNNTADVSASLTHPLLRGGDGIARSVVDLAVADSDLATLDAESTTAVTLEAVITAYWNLIFTVQDVATRLLSVQLSEELLGITQRKYEQGLQNRLDVVEVEAELARRREEQLTAEQGHEAAMDELRRLILGTRTVGNWDRPIVAETSWSDAVRTIAERLGEEALDEDTAVLTAMQNRPDIRRARVALERAELELDRASNSSLPRLDVTGSYGVNSNERARLRTLRELDDLSFHEARLFLDFELPLGNRQAEYTERRRVLERERALVTLQDTEVGAVRAVRDAIRSVELQTAKVASASETVRLRREVYEGERRRLENDLSTPYQVREFQRDLLEAIDNETRAQLDLAVSWTRLVAAQGLLVSQTGYARPVLEASPDEAPPTL